MQLQPRRDTVELREKAVARDRLVLGGEFQLGKTLMSVPLLSQVWPADGTDP